jgi:lysophospholipase L1-like esterase
MQRKNNIAFYGSCLFLLFFASLNFTNLYLRQNNSLLKSNEWRSLKAETEYPVMGAFAFLITRRALPYDSLDLGTWHGLNELVTKKGFAAKTIKFRFFLRKDSYLSFQYGRNSEGYRGFTFSANHHIKSKYFTADEPGVFSARDDQFFPIQIEDWNQVVLELSDKQSTLFVNGKLAGEFSPVSGENSIGFKGPVAPGNLIDDITVVRADGTVWTEDFSNRRNRREIFLGVSTMLLLALGIAHLLLKTGGRQLRVAGLALAVCILAFFLNQADKIYFAYYYIQSESPATALQKNTLSEMLAFNPRNQERTFIYQNLLQEYFKPEIENKFKIMFLGSSQTWGSGAKHPQDIVSEKFGRYLKEIVPEKKFEVFNGAVPGEITKDQFENFLQFSKNFPQVVILNMSVNDNRSLDVFREYLVRFVELSRKEKFRLVLIPEPFFDENKSISRSSQELVEKVAHENGVILVPAQKYMEEMANSGFLWWDVVHLSSYGQDLLAQRLTSELGETIRSEIDDFERRRRAGPLR